MGKVLWNTGQQKPVCMMKIKSPKAIDCLSLIQRANSNKIFHHKEASARLALEDKVML